jgi:Zn-dependent protease with chaperone function
MHHIMKTTFQRVIPTLFIFLITVSAFAQEEAAAAEEGASSGLALGLLMILVGVGAVLLVGLVLNQGESISDEE